MKMFALLYAGPVVASGARALRHRQPTLLQQDDFDDNKPYCVYGTRGSHGGHVEVFVGHDNVRSLAFDGDDLGTQTMVKCKGDLPQTCAGPRPVAKSLNDTQACDWLSCPCEAETSSLQFSYMTDMMNEVVPMCEIAGEDPMRESKGPFRILLIGLGGGALPMYTLNHCPKETSFESVEYDPRVIDTATNFFGLALAKGRNSVEANDGGKAIQDRVQRGEKYDVVMVDAFGPGGKVPPSCRDQAFITGAKSILKPGGKVIQQIWSPEYEKVIEDYKKAYGEDRVKGTDIELGVNHLIIAQNPDN